jgi:hypothetical protein
MNSRARALASIAALAALSTGCSDEFDVCNLSRDGALELEGTYALTLSCTSDQPVAATVELSSVRVENEGAPWEYSAKVLRGDIAVVEGASVVGGASFSAECSLQTLESFGRPHDEPEHAAMLQVEFTIPKSVSCSIPLASLGTPEPTMLGTPVACSSGCSVIAYKVK